MKEDTKFSVFDYDLDSDSETSDSDDELYVMD